ncbi:MAG: transcription termination/antitermination protein NusG [Tepidibacillus sp.]
MWYVVHVKTNEELNAKNILANFVDEVESLIKWHIHRSGKKKHWKCLLPGYVFVKINNMNGEIHAAISDLPSVIRLLESKEFNEDQGTYVYKPVAIEEEVISYLKSKVDEMEVIETITVQDMIHLSEEVKKQDPEWNKLKLVAGNEKAIKHGTPQYLKNMLFN